jgi:endonuclease/exonuclease/phosphatase (EEP) superfamily protein YafD
LSALIEILGCLMVTATVLPLIRSDHWAVRVFDFPRLQIAVVSAAVFVAGVCTNDARGAADQALFAVLALSLLYQLVRIWPYTPLHAKQVRRVASPARERSLGILISNVLMTNRHSARLRELIRRMDPDVILTVETDDWWEQELREFERTHPHLLKRPQANTYGMLLYSRLPLVDPRIRTLVQDDVPSIHTGVRLLSGDVVNLRCLHPRPPVPGESTRSTERDAELLQVAEELKNANGPSLVVGDLNDVAWSRTNGLFQKISGLLDVRIGRGLYSTFNANWPLIRFPVDHAFVSCHFQVESFEVLPHVGSDHFPVFARLGLTPAAPAENQQPAKATARDEQEAEEKISRAT